MDWSSYFPELLLASYDKNEGAPNEPDGVVMVWNTKFKKPSPDDVFNCQSAVMSSCFAKFHPNLILGGTYSGQIVLWDNRVQKRTPIQRSPLNASAHTVSQGYSRNRIVDRSFHLYFFIAIFSIQFTVWAWLALKMHIMSSRFRQTVNYVRGAWTCCRRHRKFLN